MNKTTVFYLLFEQSEDGYYGDFLKDRKLYTETEMDSYVKEHAEEVFPVKDYDKEHGYTCWFKAYSRNPYGTGMFYFREVYR